MRFKVAKGCSVLDRARTHHKSGSIVVPDKHMTMADCDGHVRRGFLIPVSESAPPTPADGDVLVENAPGTKAPTPIKSGFDEKDQVKTGPIKIESGITKVEDIPAKTQQVKSLWNFDAASLAKKGVDELNVMILERDDKVEPFETKEEAIAWMTQDAGKEGIDLVVKQTGPESKSENRIATAD